MVHPDLVITAEPTQKIAHLVARDCVKYVVSKREGKCVCNSDGVELPIVEVYPDVPFFSGTITIGLSHVALLTGRMDLIFKSLE